LLVTKLIKSNAKRVIGIDASTNSIAYCVFEGNVIVEYGEINFTGSDIYERILDAKRKVHALQSRFKADFVAIEAAVMVRSAQTGLKMAYVFGAIMGELLENGASIVEIHPITWQSFIGNKNFTAAQKAQVKKENPERSDSWIKSKIREQRKQKTLEFAKSIGVHTDSDNVGDATGLAWYAIKNLVR
jgi:Holliday junction resolvasome RuvABC endonuclease subunit